LDDVPVEGFSCGLHGIERLMRMHALKVQPQRRPLPKDVGER
jgi:putative transposase